jgi:hypothetical protein
MCDTLVYVNSWLIGVIGVGVTALIGVQLVYFFTIERRMKKGIEEDMRILRMENEKMKKRLYSYSKATGYLSIGNLYCTWGARTTAFPYYLNCLLFSREAEDSDLLHESLDKCLNVLKELPEVLENKNVQDAFPDIKECLLQIQDERAYQLHALFFSSSKPEMSQSQEE